MKKKKLPIKWIVTVLVVVLFFAVWGMDIQRAKKYDIDVIAVSNLSPIANGKDLSYITIRVTRDGKPCANHEIEVRPTYGTFGAYILWTDENGIAEFEYKAYEDEYYQPAGDDSIRIIDLSNSLLIEVWAETTYTLTLQRHDG